MGEQFPYLSHSKYGIDSEISINNNFNYKTGYSGMTTLDQPYYPGIFGDENIYNEPYNTDTGCLASTKGNISGVYDMSGGAHEYVSSYIIKNVGTSGFSSSIGDATGEMGPFSTYADKDGNSRHHNNWYAITLTLSNLRVLSSIEVTLW